MIYLMNIVFMRSKESRDKMTQYLISFAVGGLLGDVFFHTIPHMNAGHGHAEHGHAAHDHHDHGHSHEGHNHAASGAHNHGDHSHNPEEMRNNFIIILGIVAFFLIEKLT
jgi:ABC-type nickel/cobalt efflux system permease component RcnA